MNTYYITLPSFQTPLTPKWPVVYQQLHVIRNTAHRPSTQASYTASRVRPKRKISCAAAQIAATLTISFPRWCHMSLALYRGQQRMSLASYPDCSMKLGQFQYCYLHNQLTTAVVRYLRKFINIFHIYIQSNPLNITFKGPAKFVTKSGVDNKRSWNYEWSLCIVYSIQI